MTQQISRCESDKVELIFLLDEDYHWLPKRMDSHTGEGGAGNRIKALRAELSEEYLASFFTDPKDLAGLVSAAIQRWQTEKPADAVVAHVTESSLAPSWNWPRPWDFEPSITKKRRGFVGREWLFGAVCDWYGTANGPQALLICADYGVGKSVFMAELAKGNHGVPIAAYHFCDHETTETLNPTTFVRGVAAQLAAVLPEYRSAVEGDTEARRALDNAHSDPPSAFERAVVSPLNAMRAPTEPRVLLVDALDQSLEVGSTPIVQLLAERARGMPAWLKLLATSRRRPDVLRLLDEGFRPLKIVLTEDERNFKDIYRYVEARCSEAAFVNALSKASQQKSTVAERIKKASGGKFLYAFHVLNDVESQGFPEDWLEELPEGMDAFYLRAFKRLFPSEHDYEPVRLLLGILCVKRDPITKAELAAIVGATEQSVLDHLAKLTDFLVSRGKRYAFNHLSIAQWLTEEHEFGFRAGRFRVSVEEAKKRISDWARRAVADGRAHESEYLSRHLPSYLTVEERNGNFAKLLLDLRWLEARLSAAGINALLGDWADVDTSTTALATVERALRNAAHVLGHRGADWDGSGLLASQLLGRIPFPRVGAIQHLCQQAADHVIRGMRMVPVTASLTASDALERTYEGHAGPVTALIALLNTRLASSSHDKTIRVWNLSTGACDATLVGHSAAVVALETLSDVRLASGSEDSTIRLWDLCSGECKATLAGHEAGVSTLALLPDGRLASGSADKSIKVWNLATEACELTLARRANDEDEVAYGSIFDPSSPLSTTGEAAVAGHSDRIAVVTSLPEGRLASASWDFTVKIWSVARGICEATLGGHGAAVTALAVLDSGRLASGTRNGTIWIWDTTSGLCEREFLAHGGEVKSLTLLADGRLASASSDKTIKVWNPVDGGCRCEATLEGHGDTVEALASLGNGQIVSASSDDTIKLWDPRKTARDDRIVQHSGSVTAFALLADGRLASGSLDKTIKLWNPVSGEYLPTDGEKVGREVASLAASGEWLASAFNRNIELWNATTLKMEKSLGGDPPLTAHAKAITALAALNEGRLASASMDMTIKVWNTSTGECELTLRGHGDTPCTLARLRSDWLASGSKDWTIRLWNPSSGECMAVLHGHYDSILGLVALGDGQYLASGSADTTIRIWNAAAGKCIATLKGHTRAVTALAGLSEESFASGSRDKTVQIWIKRDDGWHGTVLFVADAEITALVFVRGSDVLVASDGSGRVHFLKVKDFEPASGNRLRH